MIGKKTPPNSERRGLLQHYGITCDACKKYVEWVYLMGSGWRNCAVCRARDQGFPVKCNLCTQTFDVNDPDLEFRMKKHQEFHNEYQIKNLHHGTVVWL